MRPLVVGVTELRKRSGSRRTVTTDVELPGLAISSAAVPPGGEVHVELELESVPESVVATGTVEAPWQGECRRCLRTVTGTLRADVREVFELHPVEGETYPLVDDHVDLEPVVRDAVMLSLPLAPLCDDDCRGPDPDEFPIAGEGSEAKEPDPRWSALGDLRFD
jgi:uncharacterized protein